MTMQGVLDRLGSIEWRLDNLYFIKDKFGKKVKFIRNDSQNRLWKEKHTLNLILKDRQRGFSTFVAIIILDNCLFNRDQSCSIIDLTLDDAKKKLAKIKFAYDNLPVWLIDSKPLSTDNKESLEWENGSGVTVGTSHRGSTSQILHISEIGKISARQPDKAREIRTGALNTVAPGCYIFSESTAEGRGGEFYEDVNHANKMAESNNVLTDLDFKLHFFPWWHGNINKMSARGIVISKEDENYFSEVELESRITLSSEQKAWYVKKRDQQKDDMKREYPSSIREAFESAVDGAYYKKEMAKIRKDGRICGVPYETGIPVDTFWDIGMNDQNFIWCHQRIGKEHRLINCIFGSGEGFPYYAKRLKDTDYLFGRHYLPHDVSVREMGTGVSRKKSLELLGVKPVEAIPRATNQDAVLDGINEVRDFLSTCWIDERNCKEGISALDGYRKEWDERLGCFKRTPLHNNASNGADAIRTGAVGYKDAVVVKSFVRDNVDRWAL